LLGHLTLVNALLHPKSAQFMPYEGLLFHSKSFYNLSQKYVANLQDLQPVKLL